MDQLKRVKIFAAAAFIVILSFAAVSIFCAAPYTAAAEDIGGLEIDTLEVRSVKVLADAVGRNVEIKALPSPDSETVELLSDGTAIEVAECDSDTYYRIVGRGKEMYILKDNTTTSLSRNQRVAAIIISIGAAAIIAAFALVYVHRNKQRK